MKQVNLLFSATLAAALVAPRAAAPGQISLSAGSHGLKNDIIPATRKWWDAVTPAHGLFDSIDQHLASYLDTVDNQEDDGDHHRRRPGHGGHGHHGHHRGNISKTIYELIKDNKYTTKFAELVEEDDDIKSLLQSTKHNHTLFIPSDKAFEHISPDHKKPSKEFLHALLSYHIAPGHYPARRIVHSHTIPTTLHPSSLDSHPQRLRVSAHVLTGVHLNFFSKIVFADIHAQNGVIHAVSNILVPPPPQQKIIQFLPNTFSTFSLALEKTGLGADLADAPQAGGTLFAPTNRAWTRLGPRANAFLFSDRGRKYLRALLKYSVVVNETLYSDAYYGNGHDEEHQGGGDEEEEKMNESNYWHVDLPSLLDGKPISVDVKQRWGWVSIVVNGWVRVAAQDIVAEDGVIQVVNAVLIPPRKPGQHGAAVEEDGEVEVEDLMARLEPYLEGDVVNGSMGDL